MRRIRIGRDWLRNRGALAALLAAAGVMLPAPGGRAENAEPEAPVVTEHILASEHDGYTLRYPSWWVHWELSDSSRHVISDPAQTVVIMIDARPAPADAGAPLVYGGIVEETLKSDTSYFVRRFARVVHKGLPGYVADGVYDDGRDRWNFHEYGLFADRGTWYTLRAFVDRSLAAHHETAVREVFASFSLE